jgi:hypothetical protein
MEPQARAPKSSLPLKRIIVCTAVVTLMGALMTAADAAVEYVRVKKANLTSSAARIGGRTLAVLQYGDEVDIVKEQGQFRLIKVTAGENVGKEGFIHKESLYSERIEFKATGDVNSAEQKAAMEEAVNARGGFAPWVENDDRRSNPDMDKIFRTLDDIEEYTRQTLNFDHLAAFADEGQLRAREEVVE